AVGEIGERRRRFEPADRLGLAFAFGTVAADAGGLENLLAGRELQSLARLLRCGDLRVRDPLVPHESEAEEGRSVTGNRGPKAHVRREQSSRSTLAFRALWDRRH